MQTATQDRTAVLDYLDRLGRELEEGSGGSLAELIGEKNEPDLQSRIERLAVTTDPNEDELKSLEAIVRGAMRPILRMDEGHLRLDQVEAGPWLPTLKSHVSTLECAAAAVGRILLRGHPSLTWVGTGFHVGEGLVLTTSHVAGTFTEDNGQPIFKPGITADFECGPPGTLYAISEIPLINRDLNVAVLRAEGLAGDRPALELEGTEELPRDKYVAVVGHGSGFGNVEGADPAVSAAPAAKLVSLGRIVGYQQPLILDEKMWCIAHDCTTQTGFAGGPLLDLESGRVLGVHFASQEAAPGLLIGGGFAIPVSELARDAVTRSFGLNFTSSSPEPEAVAADELAPEAPTSSAPEAPTGLVIAQVEEALHDRFSSKGKLDEDALVKFIESLGSDYARAVAAQPGRGRVESEVYCHALIVALDRRGLITPEFQGALGLKPEPPLSLGEHADAPVNFEDVEDLGKRLRQYPLDAIPHEEQLSLLLGSPYWEVITKGDDAPPPIASLVDSFVKEGSDEARAVLLWLDGRLRDYTASVASPIDPALLVPTSVEMVRPSYFREGLDAARSVGRLELKPGSGCSCWLITPDLVVVPAHVLGMPNAQGSIALAAAAKTNELLQQRLIIEFDDEVGNTRRAGVKEIAFLDYGLDIALVRLKRSDASRPPLQILLDPISSGPIASIHHAHLKRKMISVHGGRLISNDGHEVKYVLATALGVGGAPIFDANWQVIATHRARFPLAIGSATRAEGKLGTSVVAMVHRIRHSPSFATLWREIASSQRALRSIDPVLQLGGKGPAQRVVIELVHEHAKLGKVAGLRTLSRIGRIVTAIATPKAVERLSHRQGVVSVESSRSTAAPECLNSIPHIGADLVYKNWHESGDKSIVAVIDSGIDIHHEAFLDENGRTRILVFWDQQDPGSSPDRPSATMSEEAELFVREYDLRGGAVYLASDIDKIRAGDPAPPGYPSAEAMAHGTVVCSIAAGRGTGSDPQEFPGGVAPGASLIVIRYDLADATVGYSLGHVNALSFIDDYSTRHDLPVVVNVSNGMNGGAHDGKAKVEIACGEFCTQGQKPGRVVVKSAGNERQRNRHAEIRVPTGTRKKLRFFYDAQQPARLGRTALEQIQIWMPIANQYEFVLTTPSGHSTPRLQRGAPLLDELLPNGNRIRARYSGMEGENGRSLLQLDLAPGNATDIEPGRWQIDIHAVLEMVPDPLQAWIELNSSRSIQFIDSTKETNTITVPGTTEYVITVGAVEVNAVPAPYDYSSMGPTLTNLVKPEIVAPGVAIVGAGAGRIRLNDLRARDGTSLAAPHVAGSIALVLSAWCKADPQHMPNMMQIRTLLLNSTAGFNPIGDNQLGYGRLDTEAFFREAAPQQA